MSKGVPSIHCAACGVFGRAQRHHLFPKGLQRARQAGGAKAAKGTRKRWGATVPLCADCHELVHRLWGDGNLYIGPMARDLFISGLRAVIWPKYGQRKRRAVR